MSFLKKIYKTLLPKGLRESLKERYFNSLRKERFKRQDGNYTTIFTDAFEVITKLPMYYVVKDINRYEMFYTVKEDDVVIDAGANHACISIYYGKKIGSRGKVFAFEPDAINIVEMQENIALNPSVNNIEIQEKLLWNANTQLEFFEAGTVSSSIHYQPKNAKVILKDAITIDHFVKTSKITQLDFVKMDIEGAEVEAMDGLVETLKKYQPNFSIASYHWINGEQTYKKVEAFFKAHNYPYKTVFYKDGEVITYAGNSVV